MSKQSLITPALALCLALCLPSLAALTACGPKDTGKSTTPRSTDPAADNAARPSSPEPRRATPTDVAPRTAPPRAAPTTMRCPTSHSATLQAVIWPTHQAQQRRFINETRLDKVTTTKATPVEVCGARGQVAWLLRARCPNGTSPFSDDSTAHRSRKGNLGPGGRCGNVVDLYKVPCGKTTYSIHMSLYHCAFGQRFP